MTQEYTIDKLPKNATLVVSVKIKRSLLLRFKIASLLIRLAALVMGCGIEFVEPEIES